MFQNDLEISQTKQALQKQTFYRISFPEAMILTDRYRHRLDFQRSLACGLFGGGARARSANGDWKSRLQSPLNENAQDLGRRWLSLYEEDEISTVLSPYQICNMTLHMSNLKRVAGQESSRYGIAIR